MKLKDANLIAEKYLAILKPFCKRIEIAGSIRREKPEVKDIELVAIPSDISGFVEQVRRWRKIKGEPSGKYTQRILPEGIRLDLFMATERNWGNIFLIRTGSKEFNIAIMTKLKEKGLKQENGYLWKLGQIIECREEKDLFNLIGLPKVEPKER